MEIISSKDCNLSKEMQEHFKSLHKDLILYICKFLSNYEKLKFLSVNKTLWKLNNFLIFEEPVSLFEIFKLREKKIIGNQIRSLKYDVSFFYIIDSKTFPNLVSLEGGSSKGFTYCRVTANLKKIRGISSVWFADVIKFDTFPKSLTELSFEYCFKTKIESLPQSLLKLNIFCESDFENNRNTIPEGLIKLTIGTQIFNLSDTSVQFLPKSLKILRINSYIKRDIKIEIPFYLLHEGLVELDISRCVFFDSPITHLPKTLEILKMGNHFNHFLSKDLIPPGLKELELGCFFEHKNIEELPESLKIFRTKSTSGFESLKLPNGLIELSVFSLIIEDFKYLPKSLKKLKIYESIQFGKNIDSSIIKYENIFPEGLIELKFGFSFNQELSFSLPKSLKILKFGIQFNYPVPEYFLPEGLIELKFGHHFNQKLSFILPKSLKKLELLNREYPLEYISDDSLLGLGELIIGFDRIDLTRKVNHY